MTHTQSAPPLHGDDLRTAAQDFSRQWVAALPSGSLSWRRDQARESAEVAEELLRAGWTLAELLADLAAADRSRREYPRAYAERHGPQALQAARRSTREAEERQKRAKAAEEAAEWSRRKADYRARFEALPADERAALEAEIRKRHKRVADHPGIVRGLAADLLGEQLERAAELLGMVDQAELPEQHAQAD